MVEEIERKTFGDYVLDGGVRGKYFRSPETTGQIYLVTGPIENLPMTGNNLGLKWFTLDPRLEKGYKLRNELYPEVSDIFSDLHLIPEELIAFKLGKEKLPSVDDIDDLVRRVREEYDFKEALDELAYLEVEENNGDMKIVNLERIITSIRRDNEDFRDTFLHLLDTKKLRLLRNPSLVGVWK